MATRNKIGSIVLLAAILLLAGCSTAAPAVVPTQAPTQDLGAVKTEAAQTVVAAITAEALLNPSATPTSAPSATETAAPTNTPAPTLTPLPPQATATRTGGSGTGGGGGGGGGGVIRPTATTYTDRAAWVSQSLKDGIYLKPGQDFDMVWKVKNTGVRAWTTEFYYAFQSGDLEPVKGDVRFLEGEVGKNDTVDLRVDFIAPSQPGRYTSNWALINDDGVAFFHFYIVINVQ